MALTEVQQKFADSLIGERYRTEPLEGVARAWVDGGGDSVLLVVDGPHGPFTYRQPVPVEEEEQERRRFESGPASEEAAKLAAIAEAERLEAEEQRLNDEFLARLAGIAGVDRDDPDAMAGLVKRLRG